MLKVAQKLGEEGVELALAAAAQDQARVTAEAADLVYHLLAAARDARADARRRRRRARAPASGGLKCESRLPSVLIPGLLCTPRLYAEQMPALWRFGPVTVANHTHDDSMSGIARRILSLAPPKFALIGLSMGGSRSRSCAKRPTVAKLARLDTTCAPRSPRADRAARAANRDGSTPVRRHRAVARSALAAAARHGRARLDGRRAGPSTSRRRPGSR